MVNRGAWSPEQAYAMLAVRLTSSVLTLIGSTFIIFSLFYFKRMKKLPSRLIFWMAACSMVTAIINLITPANDNIYVCWIQGMVMQFSQQSTFLWTYVCTQR